MKRSSLLLAAIVMAASTNVWAQPPGGPPAGGPPRGGPPGFHLMPALDTDGDGKLSAKEITNAVAALKLLDKDKDGKLSSEEIGWPPRGGFGGRGPGGPGGFGGGQPRGRPDPDAPQPKRPSFFSVRQLKGLDRNRDGKITKEEIPRRMQQLILSRLDSDKNGEINATELKQADKLAETKSEKKPEEKKSPAKNEAPKKVPK